MRVRVEEGKVVIDVQCLHPFRVPVREWCAKTACLHHFEIAVDASRSTEKLRVRGEELPVMLEAVDTDFEAASAQLGEESVVQAILFGHEIER